MSKHRIHLLSLFFIVTLELYLLEHPKIKVIVILLTVILSISLICLGVFRIQFNYFLNSKNKLNVNKCLLTFDDGPHKINTPLILKTLNKYNIGAIFFVIGKKAIENADVLESIYNSELYVANHSYSHKNFAVKSKKLMEIELQKTETILGKYSIKLVRPPVGVTNPKVAHVIQKLGLKSYGWSVRSLDTIIKNKDTFLSRLKRKTKNGDIVLFHDTMEITVQNLEEFILESQKSGISFVTKRELKKLIHE